MTIKKTLLLAVFTLILFSCQTETPQPFENLIVPKPQQISPSNGHFLLDGSVSIEATETFVTASQFLRQFISDGAHITLQEQATQRRIQFEEDANIQHPEGYQLSISPERITIKASTDAGAFYAVQTLRQLLPPSMESGTFTGKTLQIPCIEINDQPQFKYRGMHLDVGRHLYTPEFIKSYIDALAMLKFNTFHWHLTEDQGWRIEIKKYPKLQEIAAYRNETLIGHYSDQPHQFDGKRYGGYYTQEEVKEIVAYAQKRHITIIPEIELPGHSQAAIAAYPELGCTNQPVEVATKWGVFEDIYCPKERTFEFLEDVLDEVMALFPSEYIHIGGDEAPKTRWETCDYCQKLIAKEGLKDEHELQSYFITRIERYLNSKGRQIIGWDEILEGGLAPNATVMSWRGTKGAIEAAQQGHNVIMTPTSHCYFDYYQSEAPTEPLAIGGYLPLEKVYSFNPIPEALTPEASKYVLGVQGNVWTEYMPSEAQVEYMVFPRILAMSEVNWTAPELKDYKNFSQRVEAFHKRLDALGINYANHFYEITGAISKQAQNTSYQLSAPSQKFPIHYTLNGNTPTPNDPKYTGPIPISQSTQVTACIFDTSGSLLSKPFEQQITIHKGVAANITLDPDPHKSYSGSGKTGLINGISGSDKRFGDKEWLGFWGDDVTIDIQWESPIPITTIATRFHNGQGQWIYAPKTIAISFDDGDFETYTLEDTNALLKNWQQEFKTTAQRIRFKIENYGTIPTGKQGSGNKAWTFIDEIIIN